MHTIIDKQHFRPVLSFCLYFFCALLVSLFSTTVGLAAPHEHEIQVDFAFDTQAVAGKTVNGYRLYKEGVPVCDTNPAEPQSINCVVAGEDGTYNFSLSALYDDTSESPQSAPFAFTLPDHVATPIAPVISLNPVVTSLAENTDTSVPIMVAEIVIIDADQGTNNLSITGPDAAMFTISGAGLFLKAGVVLDFETNSSFEVIVEVDDPSLPATPEDSAAFAISIADVNEAPSLSISTLTTTLAENTDTAASLKVGDIIITDDSQGINTLSLSGSDAQMFSIVGTGLFLKAGAVLDFETNPSLDAMVEVDDPNLSGTPEDSVVVAISIANVNEAPSLSINNLTTTLAENIETVTTLKIADIIITDDSQGTNTLSLRGSDASMFNISGTGLFLKAGAILDFETNPSLDVIVEVDDLNLPATPEDSAAVAISIADVNEAPSLSVTSLTTTLAENTDTAAPIKVADIVIIDADQGTNNLSVSGTDAAMFTVSGAGLFLKAGAALDFETNPSLNVIVEVDDPNLPATPEDSAAIAIRIIDIDEPALNAVITASSLNGDAPFAATFDGINSTGTISSYSWSFGDGGSATGTPVSHSFQNPGTYTVSLTISASGGATHSASITVVAAEPAVAPVVKISSSNSIGEAPLTVNFDGSASETNPQGTASYRWDFGDGDSSAGAAASHTFTTPGTFQTTLTVTDSSGLESKASTPVVVSTPEVENQPPVSSFSVVSSPETPLTFTFDASGSSDPDGSLTGYYWRFGDGSFADVKTPVHTFAEAGEYTVSLQVTDDQDETAETSQIVSAVAEDEVAFNFELAEIQVGSDWTPVTFSKPFLDPVVIAGPLSFADTEPATVRIRNVSQAGFEIRIQEWDYQDDNHAPETFSYIVMEKGVYTLGSGARIEAGTFDTGSTRFRRLSMQQSFDRTPVLLTQIMTANENDAATVSVRNISKSRFEYKLQEQESNKQRHTKETIGYIAWEPGSGEISGLFYETGITAQDVTESWTDLRFQTELPDLPLFFAGMQTSDGGDTAVVRSRDMSQATVVLNIEEEQSKDAEVSHSAEVVGYIAIGALPAAGQ